MRGYRVHHRSEPVADLLRPGRLSHLWTGTDDDTREGVSCCRSLEALATYFAGRGANLRGSIVVEIEGDEAPDADWDADEGAVLLRPTRIVRTMSLREAGIRPTPQCRRCGSDADVRGGYCRGCRMILASRTAKHD